MKLTENYFEARKEATKWLKVQPQKRNFSQGLLILQKSGYKPQVASLLVRQGEKDWTREKLMYALRELLQVYYNPDDERFTDEDVDVLNDKAPSSNIREHNIDVADVEKEGPSYKKWPEPIQQLMRKYATAYKRRAICNKERAALPDTNDAAVTAKRKALSEEMDELTTKMEQYWQLRERYDKAGEEPSTEEIKKAEQVQRKEPARKVEEVTDYEKMDTETLITKRKSAVTQRTRKENLLKYQAPSKRKTINPMPDCPRRVKFERQIEHLTEAISKMDYELAKRYE